MIALVYLGLGAALFAVLAFLAPLVLALIVLGWVLQLILLCVRALDRRKV